MAIQEFTMPPNNSLVGEGAIFDNLGGEVQKVRDDLSTHGVVLVVASPEAFTQQLLV